MMKEKIEKLAQQMVQIDSTRRTLEVAIKFKEFLDNNGIDAKLNEYQSGKANVEARIGPANTKRIVISGHMDTVPIGDISKWKHHPFSGKIIENQLWGRGSVDMKGGTACLAGVIIELLQNEDDLQFEIVLAATADEEVGLQGARQFTQDGIMKNASHLLIAEPTGLGVAVMEKGVIWVTIESFGKQSHGSRPDLGVNAIEGIARLMPKLHTVLPDNEIPGLGKSTLNVGTIKGGTVPNVVPEFAKISCDYRLTPGVKNQDIIEKIEHLLEKESNDEISFKLTIDPKLNAPSVQSPDDELGNALANNTAKYVGNKPQLGGMYYATDGAIFMEQKEVSFAIYGPGSTEMLHQTNERLDLNQLDIARKVIYQTIVDLNSNIA